MCFPDVNEVVFGATNDVLSITTEGALDLATGIQATLVLARELMVLQVVESDPRII